MALMQEKIPSHRMQITDDLDKLLKILPSEIRSAIDRHPQQNSLIEVVMDLGRLPEARFPQEVCYLGDKPVAKTDLQNCIEQVGSFSSDNRAGIGSTLHRISAIRNRTGEIIGLTCRIGRAVFGTIVMIRDLVETGGSILLLGRPGVGKTTALREIARVLADDLHKRVVIIDTSNEIAGDGDIPHPAIGRARRMQVARPELQHQVMIEAVENHMPEVIVIDEIGTELEALAARTIAERGVQLVGTAHGNRIDNLIKNPTLFDLVGGIQAVILGDEEARRRRSQKTVLERKAPPTFAMAVEMLERQQWVVHKDVAKTVDNLLRGKDSFSEVRTVSDDGEVSIAKKTPASKSYDQSETSERLSGLPAVDQDFEEMLNKALYGQEESYEKVRTPGPNGENWPVYVYSYGISRSQLEQVIAVLNLPVVLTKEMNNADAILALRSHAKNNSKLRQMSTTRQVPIHGVKSNTITHIASALKRLLGMDDPKTPEEIDLRLFAYTGSDDEIEALEEARLAVEQIVIPKGQPVELLPRSPKVRKMQHELVEHYRLHSDSFGSDPNRRLRIYPA